MQDGEIQIQWQQYRVTTFTENRCFGCVSILEDLEWVFEIRRKYQVTVRFHYNCLDQFVEGIYIALQMINPEGPVN